MVAGPKGSRMINPIVPTDNTLPEQYRADFVSVAVAAVYFERSKSRVARWCNEGRIDAEFNDWKGVWLIRRCSREGHPPAMDTFKPRRVGTRADHAKLLTDDMRDKMHILTEQEREVLERRFGLGYKQHTLQEIGDEFGVSYQWISQLQNRALRKLQQAAEKNEGN